MPAQKRKATSSPSGTYAKKRATTKRSTAASRLPRAKKATPEQALFQKILANPMANWPAVQLCDEYRGETVPLVLNATRGLLANSAGSHGGMMFRPSLANCFKNTTAVSNNDILVWDDAYTPHPEYSGLADLSTNALRYRCLAAGISVTYVGPADDLAGTLTYAFSNSPETITPDGNAIPDMHMSSGIVPIKPGGNSFVMRMFDRPVFLPIGNICSQYFNGMLIVANGVNPSNLLVKTKIYIEIVPEPSSSLADTSRPSPGGGVEVPYTTHSVLQIE